MHKHAWALVILQVSAHAALLSAWYWASWYHLFLIFVGYFAFGCLGASIGYHRLFSHRSFSSAPWFETLCLHMGNMAGLGSSICWTAIHRAHHRYTDQNPQDPHSPHHHKWYKVLWLGMFEQVQLRYVKDLMRDRHHLWWHKNYFLIHLLLGILGLLISPAIYASLILIPQAMSWSIGGALNYANHCWGYRNHNTADSSTNNWLFAMAYWGEGWHNNHHANPKKWYFGERWWEIDVSGVLIAHLRKDIDKTGVANH